MLALDKVILIWMGYAYGFHSDGIFLGFVVGEVVKLLVAGIAVDDIFLWVKKLF